MQDRLDALLPERAHYRPFLTTYRRTTEAVGIAIEQGLFLDPDWVEEWDVIFADLYLEALDADLVGNHVPGPWRSAFGAPAFLHPLVHVLLGMNAHINFDLPQSLLAVLSDADFADPDLLHRREHDHDRIDDVLTAQVAVEELEMLRHARPRLVDQALAPVNRVSTRRLLRESRRKVWHNTLVLQQERAAADAADGYAARLAELERLSAARIADLLRPGPVLLRLALKGFGVALPAET
jgi:hypothetical protein